MRITLAAVGRAKPGPARDLYEQYVGRLNWRITLKEVEERRAFPPGRLKEREGELLLAALPAGAKVVALDESGKTLTSKAFARLLGEWRDSGEQNIAFVIGGADGLSPAVRQAAHQTLAFGAMTWPHMLVRALLAEQLYRAQSILAGHPYHRD